MSSTPQPSRASRVPLVVLALAVQAACASIIGLEPGKPLDLVAGEEAGAPAPAPPGADGGIDVAIAPANYHALDDLANWAVFDVAGSIRAEATTLIGGAFDGRRVYFPPQRLYAPSLVTSYDTTQPFDAGAAWDVFDLSSMTSNARGYAGAVRAGDRVYFAPLLRNANFTTHVFHGTVVGKDPSSPPDAGWSTFEMGAITPPTSGCIGAVFAGGFVYFVPHLRGAHTAATLNGIVARYDTSSSFTDVVSWLTFDVSTPLGPDARGFAGGVFDGRSVYFVPHHGSTIARYDTTGTFVNNTSWSAFDLATLNANARGFFGGVFDGRYVYLVPHNNAAGTAFAVRYDTQQAKFDDGVGAWTIFPMASVDAAARGFTGGAFDGRYVYFVPDLQNVLVRYDTQAPFDVAASWSTFALADLELAGAASLRGAVFDGRFIYFPSSTGKVVRFDAKDPPSLPSFHPGSFL